MPMLDVYIPTGALAPDAERTLMDELTSILLRAEGADPSNAFARQISWAFLHRPEVFVAGAIPEKPHYRVIAGVPEGQLNGAAKKQQLVAEVTDAIVRAEGANDEKAQDRVWVFPLEIPEGHWGSFGSIQSLADILGAAIGDADKGRGVAQHRIAQSRQERGLPTA
ncbi:MULTISPECIES: tautomerase family protein [unclassified Streptomyces]|uniref:tautomerase family protein n=1 Tax=unclassified Streptomyces TaxID=2593676 RepID=UPI002DDBD110|nr:MULTISPECIES: tautomerase family protein [unclassified Streptomyces]WSF84152.1 tautomerase family protein [Streptomyces sp. NBC_01744]WSC39563.1 tautomerase family protein [Streptomyces sp. NBC_01763]WSC47703.1 tautomerase family protein [Streptomyces sp. NBC_01762]WSC53308.1 tautomerase family protein [Streptomyces sp. NBC_01761]WSD27355.1 tautomerase family protein [Streptomyces sp. NBC_01751]